MLPVYIKQYFTDIIYYYPIKGSRLFTMFTLGSYSF